MATNNSSPLSSALQEGGHEGSSDHADGMGHHTGSSASRASRSSGGRQGSRGSAPHMYTSPHHSSHSSQGSHTHHASPNRHGDGVSGHPSSRHQKHTVVSQTTVTKATTGSGRLERGGNIVSTSWDNLASAVNGKEPMDEEATANYPTSAAEILPILKEKITILSGGRDRQGQSLVTFPAQTKTYMYDREDILRTVQYLTSIPTEDVRDIGFSVVVDARNSTWQNTKLILRTLQEALPAQIHVVYIIQSGHFWQKQQTSRGHSKVKAKLEFSTVKLSSVEKLIRHVESSQLTADLGGFLPYNHDEWIKLRLDLEHFISSFNALMEHTAHVEQQLRLEPDASDVEAIEDFLGRHVIMQDQLKKAPQNTIREGNELLRNLEQGRDEAGTSSMTPDKINAIAVIKRLLDNIGRRQVHLDDLWRERKIVLERTLQLKVFEKSLVKVKGWLKSRGEEVIGSWSNIGDSLETAQAVNEQHQKFESKARQNHSSLTQLRRMADKMTGEHHFAAEGAQRQVAKLNSRFSRFESHLAERRAIVHASVKVHTMLNEWRTQSNHASGALKQKVPPTKPTEPDQSLSNHSEQLSKLEQLASTIMLETSNLIDLMKGTTQHATESGRGRLDYSAGINHVKQLVEEVENHRTRVGQLAEAQKLHSEQFKQLHSCEKDARQVTQWLHDMCQQMSTTHGDIGDSLSAAIHLIGELDKFNETAKKTYQYGCDLVSAAQRTRQSHSFDPHTSSSLLTELTLSWEKLTTAITENRERLLAAKEFHSMAEESLAKYSDWSTPIFQLPKNAQLVREKLIDMAEHKDDLNKKMENCISAGSTLLDRLCRPLLPDASFRSLNDHTKRSLAFLRSKQEELERHVVELTTMVPRQEALFTEFITYCEFEQSIELVLVWLQEHGLKQIQSFSRIKEGQSAVKEQLVAFDEFHEKCKEYTTQVEKLHNQAPQIESQIHGFKSELVKKATSLKTVWDKFLQRVDNRRKILLLTSGFYDNTAKLHRAMEEMAAVLSTEVVSRKGSTYLDELLPRKQLLDKLFEGAKKQGGSLLDLFRRSPVDQGDPSSVISSHLFNLEAEKYRADELWESGRRLVTQSVQLGGLENSAESTRLEPIGQVSDSRQPLAEKTPTVSNSLPGQLPPYPDVMMSSAHVKHVKTGEKEGIKKVKVVRGQSSETVSRKHADRYAELEEEAYKHLEWLEQECDTFLKSHTRFRESPDGASVMKTQHEQFLSKIDPTCEQVDVVLESLQQLKPETLPLAPSIDQLCNVVSERVKGRRNTLKRRANTLKLYADFCSLFKEIDINLQTLDDYLDKSLQKSISMDTAQEILDQYGPLMDKVSESYKIAMSLGEQFLEVTSDMLSGRGGPKLSVGDACTSVAVDMGDLEGRYPDTKQRWTTRETELTQKIDWQAFKVTCDQLCSWLKDSAGMFLQSRVDVGTSLETAEDLLMEQQEFEIRAKRTASEVQSLLTKSEEMLSGSHFASSELRDKAYDLRKLHSSFVSKLDTRRKTLSNSVQFYLTSQELERDMDNAIEACSRSTPVDLSTNLKITSVSTRLTNLQHTANKLLEIVGGSPVVVADHSPKKPKQKTKRSDSASASELTIKQTLAILQKTFTQYKQAFERRRVSPSPQSSSGSTSPRPRNETSGTTSFIALRKFELKSPSRDKTASSSSEQKVDLSTKEGDLKRLSSGKDRSREGTVVSPNISPYHRSRTYTDFLPVKKQAGGVSAVRKKVAALNKKADKEDEQPLTEFCTSFGIRPRAQTTDSVLRTPETSSNKQRKSDSKTPTPSPIRVSETAEKKSVNSEISDSTKASLSTSEPKKAVKAETAVASVPESSTTQSTKVKGEESIATLKVESEDLTSNTTPPAASLSVPLRRKKTKGLSRSERSEKIAAIRALFESGEIVADLSLNKPDTSPSHSASTGVKSASRPASGSIKSETTGVKSTSRPASGSIKSESPSIKQESESSKTDHERGPSPSVVISPPPDTRQRVYTAPTVYKTILKDYSPAKKRISVITVSPPPPQESISPPPLEGVAEKDEKDSPELEKKETPPEMETTVQPTTQKAADKKTEPEQESKIDSNLASDTANTGNRRFTRATRSASPQQLHRVDKNESSKTSPLRMSGFRRPPLLKVSGKVSSLRSLFDSTASGSSMLPIPRTRSDSKPVTVVKENRLRRSSVDHAVSVYGRQIRESHDRLDCIQSKPTVSYDQAKESHDHKKESQDPSNEKSVSLIESHDLQELSHDSSNDTHRIPSPDIIPKEPERPQLPNPADLSPPTAKHPPPRPPSPVGYYLDHEPDSESSDVELEFEIEFMSDSETSPLEEEDFDRKWTEEGVDGPGEAPDSATLVFKSLHTVLSEFLLSEMTYSQSVQTLVEVYLPSFNEEHIPTFLQGRKESIFSNLAEIHLFHRKFYLDLSEHEDSLEGVCNTILQHAPEFKCYVPFLCNMERGLQILSQYGGSFFHDKQREIGDEMSVTSHYCRLKERWKEYLNYFKELYVCAQKEYLHGVSLVKDIIAAIHETMTSVDNAITLDKLRSCPYSLDANQVIRCDLFSVYLTHGKKKPHLMLVCLHSNHVVFAHAKRDKTKDITVYEYRDSIEVASMHMLETYKSQLDKFALCEGRPTPGNLYVLQAVDQNVLMKRIWMQEIRPLLQKNHNRERLVGVEEMPLPLSFRTPIAGQTSSNPSEADKEGWFSSLKRRGSFKRRNSIKRNKMRSVNRESKEERFSVDKERVGAQGTGLVLRRESSKFTKRDLREVSIRVSAATSESSTSSAVPVAGATVELASISARGQFLPTERDDQDLYVVMESFTDDREGFLSVEIGQLVEVLDDSGPIWMVLALPMAPGDLEAEGFIPGHIVRPAGQAGFSRPSTMTGSHTSKLSHQWFEAETGQEIPSETSQSRSTASGRQDDRPSINVEPVLDELHSEETTGQNITAPVVVVAMVTEKSVEDNVFQSSDQIGGPSISNNPPEMLVPSGDFQRTVSQPGDNIDPASIIRPGLKFKFQAPTLSTSIRSLPSSFSPTGTPRSPHTFLGYNPMMIPDVTLSQPELTRKQPNGREELMKLQKATVKEASMGSVDDFDPVEVYVAIADFEAAEESNVSLSAGQCVQLLDNTRSDWWLVSDGGRDGWVPAAYLEQQTLEAPSSPPPEPFEDETGELQRIMMKDRTLSDINITRQQLYKSSFLSNTAAGPEDPSEAQLQGMHGIAHSYVTVTEIQASSPGQLSLVQDQPVKIIDSKRSDWWLVSTIPVDDSLSSSVQEGWVPANQLAPAPYIREDGAENGVTMVTSRGEVKVQRKSSHGQMSVTEPTVSPRLSPMWVVLADYEATEPGMLSVHEGELVEVLDISRNDWCLIRPASRQSMEGWVPTAFLKPYNDSVGYSHPSMLPTLFRSRPSPDDSDTPTEVSDRDSNFSPELLEPLDNEEKRTDAKERRRFCLSELISSEREYVEKLQYCIENYIPAVDEDHAPKPVKILRGTLFGNLEEIYTFHKSHLLPKLLECEFDPTKLGDVFVSSSSQLHMYVSYCQNKAASDDMYQDHALFFEEVRMQLGDRLKLQDFLILPVQRITKYNLLLQDFNKYSVRSGLEGGNIDAAIEVTRGVSTQANNTIHLSLMEGVDSKELGELALQDLFLIQESQRQVFKERRVFLFRKALIITKKRRESSEKETYITKEKLMLTDISMTQDMDTNKQNIIIYEMLSGTKFILKALKTSTRDSWLTTANELIRTAKRESVNNLTVRGRSSTDPLEYILRSPILGRKLKRDREGSSRRRSMKRPHSSTGPRESVTATEDQPPAGTEYVVMECIVMEGSDDTTLDPGEIVKLVRVEPSTGSLRVRTQDDNHFEGVVPASYLRRRDLVKAGARMESTPKLTMKPVDMDLLTGTTATISCAFNGYPLPSVVWRKDFEILSSDSRRKITSCATSSVLEVIQLDFEDEGTYSCYVTNSMGSDSAEIYLSIHGPPSQPPKPTVSKVTSSSVKLKWAVPELDGGSPILSYQIELLQEGFDQWQPIVQHPRNYFVVKTLDPQTSYQFRVIAYNEYGASMPSEPTKVVGTKSKGWLTASPSFKKPPMITIDGTTDYPDAPFDQLGVELVSPLSPKHAFIRRGSLSVLYDVMPEELGRGRFGIVHKCLHKQNGLEYAAKYVRLRSKRKAETRREVEILQMVRGKTPHIAELQDAFERGRNLIVVTELVPDGELVERIIADDDLTEGVAVGYISQLLSAVECLHQLNIAHLDIRPENILLYGIESPTLKLIDFGAAREVSMVTTPVYTSSIEFCAPEIITQALPTLASDMWSIGVLTYVILSGISPFFVDNIQVVVERIKEARYNFYNDQFDQISQEAKDFIAALLQKSPEYRMSVSDALQHQWIRTLSRSREGATSPWPMARLDNSRLKTFNARRKWHTMSVAIDDTTVFGPRSMLCLSPVPPDFEELAKHEAHPRLWDGPTHMRAPVGTSVTFQFQVSGQPEPTVIWEHGNEEIVTSPQYEVKTSGGVTSLSITEVERDDEGLYTCSALNSLGSAVMECHLTVLDVPGSPSQVNSVILGYNSTLISWLPPTTDGNCLITSYILEKRRLEVEVWEGVASDIDSTAHVVEELIPGATYIFRVFSVNEVGVSVPSKPSRPVTMVKDRDYDSDSPSPAEVTLKITPIEFEYEINEELWRGSYSVVSKCRERTTDRVFVTKVMSVDEKERAFQEFEILRQLSHPRLVTLEDAFMNNDQLILVLQYLPGGSLEDYMSSHGPLSEQLASLYTRKIMEGLQYLHATKIIHAKIAPDNLLLSMGCKDIKICDFGMARYIEVCNQLQELRGNIDFMAPEAVSLQPLTTAADIWSTGTIVYWMVTAISPFAADSQESTIDNIRTLRIDKTNQEFTELSHDCQDFMLNCTLIKNPRRRLTAEQSQRHRWLHRATASQRRPSNDPPLPRMGSERHRSSHYKRRSFDSYSHSQ